MVSGVGRLGIDSVALIYMINSQVYQSCIAESQEVHSFSQHDAHY